MAKNRNWTMLLKYAYICRKTIKKNKEMINTRVKITLEGSGDAQITSEVLVMFFSSVYVHAFSSYPFKNTMCECIYAHVYSGIYVTFCSEKF